MVALDPEILCELIVPLYRFLVNLLQVQVHVEFTGQSIRLLTVRQVLEVTLHYRTPILFQIKCDNMENISTTYWVVNTTCRIIHHWTCEPHSSLFPKHEINHQKLIPEPHYQSFWSYQVVNVKIWILTISSRISYKLPKFIYRSAVLFLSVLGGLVVVKVIDLYQNISINLTSQSNLQLEKTC